MPKAIISNKIYMDIADNPMLLEKIKNALTYKIKKPFAPGRPPGMIMYEVIKQYKLLGGNKIITMPSGRVDLIPEDYEIVDKRTDVPVALPEPALPLSSTEERNQQAIYDKVTGSCLVNAKVGFGKTFLALHLIKKLGQKTLVVVPTTMLRDQWVDQVKRLYGFTPGVIGSGSFNLDTPIVIGNVQTVVKKVKDIEKAFGLVVVDECLDYNTSIQTREYGTLPIGKIVNQKLPVHVLSLDPETGITSYKQVLNWYKNKHTSCLKIHHSGGGNFKCTHNHGVYTWSKGEIVKIPAEHLEVGDLLLQTVETHKSTRILNEEWKPLVLGLALGDGSFQYPHASSDSIRLSITHGQAQFEYLDWKKSIMGETTESIGKSGYKPENAIKAVVTKSFYDTDDWYGQMYVKGHKKRIPASIVSEMDARSWALLFQDDGSACRTSARLTFSVCELDEESVDHLISSLHTLFGITDAYQTVCSKGYRYLSIRKEGSLRFMRGVNGLIHPNLQYKLEMLDEPIKPFSFPIPEVPLFNENFCVRRILKVEEDTLTHGHRFNIEVADNHTYFASGILVANCHHASTSTFSTVLEGMHSTYKIGLSGTLKRKDGRQVTFPDYFGHDVYVGAGGTMAPSVLIVKTNVTIESGESWAEQVNTILYDPLYQAFVAKVANVQSKAGHKVLVIADRVEFLQKIGEHLGETCVCIIGGTDFETRESLAGEIIAGTKSVVAGSRQIFSEGISIDPLSCVILATPMAAPVDGDATLEQIIGRVQRKYPDKLEPLVVDLQFEGRVGRRQARERLSFYLRSGWKVKYL